MNSSQRWCDGRRTLPYRSGSATSPLYNAFLYGQLRHRRASHFLKGETVRCWRVGIVLKVSRLPFFRDPPRVTGGLTFVFQCLEVVQQADIPSWVRRANQTLQKSNSVRIQTGQNHRPNWCADRLGIGILKASFFGCHWI